MNKERAREILKTIRHNSTMQTDYTIDDIDQALDIAIDSLEQDQETKEKMWAKQLNECEECKILNNEWVDVRDRLPSESGMYLVTNFDNVSYTTWTTTCHYKNGFELDGVIAWKPLPQPYERKE